MPGCTLAGPATFGIAFRPKSSAMPSGSTTDTACRQWCGKFGPDYARQWKRRQGRLGDTWFLDEVFVTINGERQYLWRAVDQDGDLIDILVQPRMVRENGRGE